MLDRSQVLQLDEQGLRTFLTKRAAEGQYLDYKIALSGESEKEQRREFLKDVSGFANALGGHIVIGAKEPADDLSVDGQLVGIARGDEVAQALENLVRDCTQPRVPGFFIHPVRLATGAWALVAHIPASAVRPHMVDYAGMRTFYVRRRSSTDPMTVTDIRETILSAVTAEQRAKATIAERRAHTFKYFQGEGTSHLLLQAVPLIQAEEPWLVEEEKIARIVRGSDRRNKYHSHGIVTQLSPRITMEGLLASNNFEDPVWVWEVHRSGYVSILVRIAKRKPEGFTGGVLLMHKGFHDPFFVLAEMLNQLWQTTGFDAPYVLAAEISPAKGIVFQKSSQWMEYTDPYWRDEMVWPLYRRDPGQDAMGLAQSQIGDLYRGFGMHPPRNLEPGK